MHILYIHRERAREKERERKRQGSYMHICVFKHMVTYRLLHTYAKNVHQVHCPFSHTENTTMHTNTLTNRHTHTCTRCQWNTNVPVVFKGVQLNVMLNIISFSTFINLRFYRKTGVLSADRDLPRL